MTLALSWWMKGRRSLLSARSGRSRAHGASRQSLAPGHLGDPPRDLPLRPRTLLPRVL